MGIASLILGIIGVICCFLVVVAPLGVILTVVGLILGIVDTVKKGKSGEKKGLSIAGLIICAITFVVLIVESLFIGVGLLIYAEANDAINNTHFDENNISNQAVALFNSIYEMYEGTQTGSSVRTLLSTVSSNNLTNTERIIKCKLDGATYEPTTIRNMINLDYEYYITLYYDYEGYVDEISILTFSTPLMLQKSSQMVNNTSWISRSDGSEIVFEEEEFKWYQIENEHDDNYYFGKFEFYIGDDAVNYITTELSSYGVTEEELKGLFERNSSYDKEKFVVFYFQYDGVKINGEIKNVNTSLEPWFGFILNDNTYLDMANMNTGTYFYFDKK